MQDVQYIPISALLGDNVVERSASMPWYQGSTLMFHLENLHISSDLNHIDGRFPIQYVIRPRSSEQADYRSYAGRIASGVFREGEEVMVLPSGMKSRIRSIRLAEQTLPEAYAPMSVDIRLEEEIDIGRGDMIVRENNLPTVGQDLEVMVCWFSSTPLQPDGRYLLLHTTREVRCQVRDILYAIDVKTLRRVTGVGSLSMNDIGRIRIRTAQPLFYDSYRRNRYTGGIILIDENTHETVAAAMII